MNIKIPIKVKGFIHPQVFKDGKLVRELKPFPNLMTNRGRDRLAGTSSWASSGSYCFVGTGNTAPAVTDLSLDSQLAKVVRDSGTDTVVGSPDYYHQTESVFKFAVGAVAGNVAELGFSTTSTDADLCVRELVRDGGGSPTTIPVAADEQLIITYIFRKYVPTGDYTGTTPEGVSYTLRAARATNSLNWSATSGFQSGAGDVSAYSGSLGTIEDFSPGGSQVGSTASNVLTPSAYTSGDYALTYTGTVPGADCNGTIQSMKWFGNFGTIVLQIEFGAALVKTSSDKIDISFTIGWDEKAI